MKVALIGFGALGSMISKHISPSLIFDINERLIGHEEKIKPGILLDELPRTATRKINIQTSSPEDVIELIRKEEIDVGIIAINYYAERSALFYAESLIVNGAHVINLTPIPIYRNKRLRELARDNGVILLGDFIKPKDDPMNIIGFLRTRYHEIYVLQRISFDFLSLVNLALKRRLEEMISSVLDVSYTIDLRKDLGEYSELIIVGKGRKEEFNFQFLYPHRERVIKNIIKILQALEKNEYIRPWEFFYLTT